MPNSLVAEYRKTPAGQADQRTDYALTREWGLRAQQEAPELFTAYPDFAREYYAIKVANNESVPESLRSSLSASSGHSSVEAKSDTKDIATGKHTLALETSSWSRLRETAIGGALASLPFVALILTIGWLRRVKFKGRGRSPAISNVPSVPVSTIQPVALPIVSQSVSPSLLPDGGRRLAELKEIFEQGLISRQEYDSKREAIIAQL